MIALGLSAQQKTGLIQYRQEAGDDGNLSELW
jgi:hypothetical protein